MTHPRPRKLDKLGSQEQNDTQALVKLLITLAEHGLRETYRSLLSEVQLKRLIVQVKTCRFFILACIYVFLFGKSISIDMEKFSMKELCRMAKFVEKKLNCSRQNEGRRGQSKIVAEIEKLGRYSQNIRKGILKRMAEEDILSIEEEIKNTLQSLIQILQDNDEEGYILDLQLKVILRKERTMLWSIKIDITKTRLMKFRKKPANLRYAFFCLLRSPTDCISLTCFPCMDWIRNNLPEFIFNNCVKFPDNFLKLASLEEFKDNGGVIQLIREGDLHCMARYLRSQNYKSVPGDAVFVSVNDDDFHKVIDMLQWYIFETPSILDTTIHAIVSKSLQIPPKIFSSDIDELKKLSKRIVDSFQTEKAFTINFIGCARAGKTTLIQRLRGKGISQEDSPNETVQILRYIFSLKNGTLTENIDGKKIITILDDEERRTTQRTRYVSEPPIQPYCRQRADWQTKLDVRRQKVSDMKIMQSSSSRNERVFKAFPAKSIEKSFEGNYGECDVFPLLPSSLVIENQQSTQITVQDFAGVAHIYTCHSVALSAGGMAVLVIDMSKRLDDYSDMCKKWVESVHVNCGINVPIILALTHADCVASEQELNEIKRKLWTKISSWDRRLQNHFSSDRMVIVGFDSDEGVSQLKHRIIELASSVSHSEKHIPLSYVVYEHLLQNLKTTRKIIDVKTFSSMMEQNVPKKLQLSHKQLLDMLKHFHDSKQILYLGEQNVQKVMVLDVQWFVDVLCKILFAKCPSRIVSKEWYKLNSSGILHKNIFQEICKDELNVHEIEHFMHFLENMSFASPYNKAKNIWYIPSMNSAKFLLWKMQNFIPTSTICFVFDILPDYIFSRLISRFIVQENWNIMQDEGEDCLYENAAILMKKEINIIIGSENSAIHVHGMCLRDFQITEEMGYMNDVKLDVEHHIRDIMGISHSQRVPFSIAYKCKKTFFSDDSTTSLIAADSLKELNKHQQVVQCPFCPMQYAHSINVKEVLKPWIFHRRKEMRIGIQRKEETENSQAPHPNHGHQYTEHQNMILETRYDEGHMNFLHFRELTDLANAALRKEFDKRIAPENLKHFLNANKEWMTRGEYRFNKEQLQIIFPGEDRSCKSEDLDGSIMYKIFRNAFISLGLNPPKNGWGKKPDFGDIDTADDIERFHQHRNDVSHWRETSMKEDEFKTKSADLMLAIVRIGKEEFKQQIVELDRRYPSK